MGETDLHRDMMIDLIESLKHHFRQQPNVYVSGNILLYYELGNPRAHLSPDVMVTTGLQMGRRETYKLWEIGKGPDLVVEITSRSTMIRDLGVKKGLYEVIGVKDYILFDPRNEYLKPRFQVFRSEGGLLVIIELISESTESVDRGAKFIRYRDLFRTPEYYLYDPLSQACEGYRLSEGRYQPIPIVRGAWPCQTLGLHLAVRGKWLRWLAQDGTVLPTGEELAEEERDRAEEERDRAEMERDRAEIERERAEMAEREVARLRAELAELRQREQPG